MHRPSPSAGVPGRSPEQWQKALGHYQAALIATGEFPHLATAGPPQPTSPEDRERYFTLGLDWLLRGIASTIEPRSKDK